FYREQEARFVRQPAATRAILGLAVHAEEHASAAISAAPISPGTEPQLAAWTATARVLLNLDEFITRE
ncbi:MAG: hypothetical protein AB7F89_03620, partial [Pirellulaceae bacterium]